MKVDKIDYFDDFQLVSKTKTKAKFITLFILYGLISLGLTLWQNWTLKESGGMFLVLWFITPMLFSRRSVGTRKNGEIITTNTGNRRNMFNNPNIFDYTDPHRQIYNEMDPLDPKNPWK